jgi:hypothetical protein
MVLSNELPTMLQLMGHFLASVIAWRGRELARLQAARGGRGLVARMGSASGLILCVVGIYLRTIYGRAPSPV